MDNPSGNRQTAARPGAPGARGRIRIARAGDDLRTLGRPLMADHNASSRLWALVALAAVPLGPVLGTPWWLPVHAAMLGAASQAIVGGQLMFSATLGLARGPSRATALAQLVLLNVAAGGVIAGRLAGSELLLAAGSTLFCGAVAWAALLVRRMWADSVNRRFAITGTFYGLAAASILVGAAVGAGLGTGLISGTSYLAHRDVHMAFNLLGWAGLTTVGTAVTLLPTVLHVRAPSTSGLRATPWLMAGGLAVHAMGAALGAEGLAASGAGLYLGGLAPFGLYCRSMLTVPRRRPVPTASLHLLAALAWLVVSAGGLGWTALRADHLATRHLLVAAAAAGFVLQALLGAWSFLVPSLRRGIPEQRRRELVAMEWGGRTQVVVYNLGVVLALAGGSGPAEGAGIALAWAAALWALLKTWAFPFLARLPATARRAEVWWAAPESAAP